MLSSCFVMQSLALTQMYPVSRVDQQVERILPALSKCNQDSSASTELEWPCQLCRGYKDRFEDVKRLHCNTAREPPAIFQLAAAPLPSPVHNTSSSWKMVGGFACGGAVQSLKVGKPPPLCHAEHMLSFSTSAIGVALIH